jgi:hypothetical protein
MTTSISAFRGRLVRTLLVSSLGVMPAAHLALATGTCSTSQSSVNTNLGTVTTNPDSVCVSFTAHVQCKNLTFSAPGPFSQQLVFSTTVGCITEIVNVTYTGSYAIPGFIRPKYQVVGVYYSPPGAKSTATYANGFLSGTSSNVTNGFGEAITVSVQTSGGINLFDVVQAGASDTTTFGWVQQQNSSNSISIVDQESLGTTIAGPLSSSIGVDHDFDVIAILLNPEVSMSITSANSVAINGYFLDPRDPLAAPDVVFLTVGQLNGTQSILGGTPAALNRTWDPILGALDTADFAEIVKADPFATDPGFNPTSDTTGRYSIPGGGEVVATYEPEPEGDGSSSMMYTSSYNTTNTTMQSGSDKYTVGYSIDTNLSASFFVSGMGNIKASTTFSYTNTWSSTVTAGTTQSANFTIFRPLFTDNYTGPINMQVWKDNVYGTFMFFPVN